MRDRDLRGDLNGDLDLDLLLDTDRFFRLFLDLDRIGVDRLGGERLGGDLLGGDLLEFFFDNLGLDRERDRDFDLETDFGDLDLTLPFLEALLRLMTFLTSYLGSSLCFRCLWLGNDDLGEDCLGEICLTSEVLLLDRLRRLLSLLLSLLLRNLLRRPLFS